MKQTKITFKGYNTEDVLTEAEVIKWMRTVVTTTITRPRNVYSRYDASTSKAIIEIKSRNRVYNDVMLEKAKYDVLVQYAKVYDKAVIYVVADADGIYAFDLLSIQPEWKQYFLPSVYNVGAGDNPHRYKWCYNIPKSKGVNLLSGEAYREVVRMYKDSVSKEELTLTVRI